MNKEEMQKAINVILDSVCKEKSMITTIDLLLQLAFELGEKYRYLYEKAGLDNVIDFNDIAFANSCGAEWNFKGDMSDFPKLFEVYKLKQDRIDELNKTADELKKLKQIVKNIIEGEKE